jgi:hypothetical protein
MSWLISGVWTTVAPYSSSAKKSSDSEKRAIRICCLHSKRKLRILTAFKKQQVSSMEEKYSELGIRAKMLFWFSRITEIKKPIIFQDLV